MEPLLTIVPLFGLFVFGGLATYTLTERRYATRWQRTTAGPGQAAAIRPARPPRTIRRTALWSIYMGQMAVPGGLLGMFGLMAAGIGLVGIPGMILAIRSGGSATR